MMPRMSKPIASLILAERSVPRYTSYPTAPHFSNAVDAKRAAQWLRDVPGSASLSLYLHVPFCSAICNYCGCNTKAVRKQEPLDEYTETLLREIALMAEATPARRVTDLHWGGGTPSLLGPERLLRLWTRVSACFDVSKDVEHAIELDPRTVDAALVEGLAKAGVTRASLGVQDLNDHVQVAIGRVQPFSVVEEAVRLLRGVGIAAINLDLMYGLPHQSEADVRRTAELAASLDPSRLAIFGYAHVPWFKVHQKLIDAAALPGAAERIAQADVARQTLERLGYEAIGLDHFARPDDPMAIAARNGTLRRNFQGYTTDQAEALLPLGASSIGRFPQGYVQNAPDVAGWRRAVNAGRLAVVRGVAFTDEDRARSAAIERLMCDFAVDYGTIAQAYLGRLEALDDAAEPLRALVADGVVELDGRSVTITEAGKPFMRLAAAAFDTYLKAGAARHSVAV
jgi:oxygen-independent coproporphyrinogen-3 oxidase